MNYANMIEERRLKQGFILATLASTIAGTFTTGINLYDRIIEKRRQAKLDKGQDEKIRDLEAKVSKRHGGGNMHHQRSESRSPDNDRLRQSLQYGGGAIKDEYDSHYAELGSRYAEGDVTAQLQLQSAIITLQQTVISVLEDSLFTGQPPDISKLYNASEFARQGSVRALRDQYRRMLEASSAPSGALARRPAGPIRRISSTSALDERYESQRRALPPPAPSVESSSNGDGTPLFCPAAVDLQESPSLRVNRILSSKVSDPVCTSCTSPLPLSPWRVEKEIAVKRDFNPERNEEIEVVELRTFQLTGRFLAKCHRPGGGYACWMCARWRNRDTVCESVEGLVRHVTGKHSVRELEKEGDVVEVRRVGSRSQSRGGAARSVSRGRSERR